MLIKICAIAWTLILLTCGQVFSEGDKTVTGQEKDISQSSDIIVSGKVFCSLRRHVILPFHGTIISLNARAGQHVKKDEVLARYRLAPEAALKLRQRLASFQIEELELRLAEIEEGLAKLEDKRKEVISLSDHNMAPSKGLDQIGREIGLLNKKKRVFQERLPLEQSLVVEEKTVVTKLLGASVEQKDKPVEGVLKSPVACHVIWVHPELQVGAELMENAKVISVGVMDPMVIRAQVHEIEAMRISLGDEADFSLESIPDLTFRAKISRISWSSLTPMVDSPSYYEVELEVPNPEYVLREGLRGRIVFRKNNK